MLDAEQFILPDVHNARNSSSVGAQILLGGIRLKDVV